MPRRGRRSRPSLAVHERPVWRRQRTNLPASLTSFVGREAEIAALVQRLTQVRLLTLGGIGGVGKTRLALTVARAALDRYPDGVWWIDLSSVTDPTQVASAVATALGVREALGRTPADQLVDVLREQSVLLVLDNCERVAAACGELLDAVLKGGPRCAALATSRRSLGVGGEFLHQVLPFATPDQTMSAADLLTTDGPGGNEAIRLFVARAQHARSTFTLTADNWSAVASICRRVDGLPLAIELAAARIGALSAEQVATSLDQRLSILTFRSAHAPRHQTLRALFDWSYRLLGLTEQALFRRLSVFAGGWTLEAAGWVGVGGKAINEQPVGGENFSQADDEGGVRVVATMDGLAALVDASLVVAEEAGGGVRYRFLNTVRDYARERLDESGETTRLQARQLQWYLGVADEGDVALHGADQQAWLLVLEREHDNLRVALLASAAGDGWARESGLALTAALGWFWLMRGHVTEGRRLASLVMDGATPDSVQYAKALRAAIVLAFMQGDFAAAAPFAERGLALGRAAGAHGTVAHAIVVLSAMALFQGDVEQARTMLDDGRVYFEDDPGMFHMHWLYARAQVTRVEGSLEEAVALGERGMAYARQQQDAWGTRHWLVFLGQVTLSQGEHQRATALLQEALTISGQLEDRWGAADAIEGLAWVAAASQDGRQHRRGRQPSMEQAERAACLIGAAEALREALGMQLFGIWQVDHDSAYARSRAALNADGFAQAVGRGRAMPLGQVVTLALDGATTAARGQQATARNEAGLVLTGRERDVAVLIARGLTNREIANELVIAEGTAAVHVGNILRKLDVVSRAQVAAWAVDAGLVR